MASHSRTVIVRRLTLQESKQIMAMESPLSPLSHPKTGKPSRVCPSPQRSLADVEECGGLADVEQLVQIGYRLRRQGFTQ